MLFTRRLWSRFLTSVLLHNHALTRHHGRTGAGVFLRHAAISLACDADPQRRHGLFWTRRDVRVGRLLTFTIWSSMINGPTKARIVPNKTAMTPATINPTVTLYLLISMSPHWLLTTTVRGRVRVTRTAATPRLTEMTTDRSALSRH